MLKEIGKYNIERTPDMIEAWRDGRSRNRIKKRLLAGAFVLGNVILVTGLVSFIYLSQKSRESTAAILDYSTSSKDNLVASRPLDQLSSADIAVSLAQMGRFEEVYWVAEQAASVEYLSALPTSSDPIAEKPRVVNSTIRTRKDISTYVVAEGDTLSSIALKFSVSSDSIKWSNSISGSSVSPGEELVIPPQGLDGIVYKVAAGDTVEALAKKYRVSTDSIVSFNDVESGVLPVAENIFLPSAQQPTTRTYSAPVRTSFQSNGTISSIGYTPTYGANGYVYGHCTYYLATKANAPNGLGNANRWDTNGPAFGYTLSKTPTVGSIAQRDWGSYYGHVAYVEAVSEDGSMIKYSDMNGQGGWNRVYYSDWVPVSEYNWYMR